ncbi:hypothetical protein GCM10018965_050260 [Nonomuraea roseola]
MTVARTSELATDSVIRFPRMNVSFQAVTPGKSPAAKVTRKAPSWPQDDVARTGGAAALGFLSFLVPFSASL